MTHEKYICGRNTRTTAIFFIKYLRTLGFDATNDIFAENAWYFRNALVRANRLLSFSDTISEKTINHALKLFSKCGKEECFGRTIVEAITGLKPSGASKLIKLLVDSKVIVPVTGHGKGKYRFQ